MLWWRLQEDFAIPEHKVCATTAQASTRPIGHHPTACTSPLCLYFCL